MEEVGVFLWFCTDNSCVSVCPSVPRVSLAHLLLRLNKRNDLDIKYTHTQSKCQTKESRGTGTRPGQDFMALVSYSCLPEAIFLFGGPSVSEHFLIQMEIFANDKQIFHYRAAVTSNTGGQELLRRR